MPASLADLSIAVVVTCRPERLVWPAARRFVREWEEGGFPFECARAFLNDSRGKALPDSVDIVFDPWLHAGFFVYGENAMLASGPDPASAVRRWLIRAQERGF